MKNRCNAEIYAENAMEFMQCRADFAGVSRYWEPISVQSREGGAAPHSFDFVLSRYASMSDLRHACLISSLTGSGNCPNLTRMAIELFFKFKSFSMSSKSKYSSSSIDNFMRLFLGCYKHRDNIINVKIKKYKKKQ